MQRQSVVLSASSKDIEEGLSFAPKFDRDGLVTVVATDATSGEVLMVAHMNAEALSRTVATGEAWYYSRSRKTLWKKGESSGHRLVVKKIEVDCDRDAVLLQVDAQGPGVCHEGYNSCFFRTLEGSDWKVTEPQTYDPKAVYSN